ncbi:hypothetical protein [Brevibacillus daliensis]|uniref:hypothetical protein n=1 Tax=Brevibacillus daliensis TaxID=2892995 RepID=UPI001E3FE1D1|nr:hypothetical protein [Brevibacillus daliensis]
MSSAMPYFLIAAGLLVAYQPKTKRWQRRLSAFFGGDQKRVDKRAKTFYLLGMSMTIIGCFLLIRM